MNAAELFELPASLARFSQHFRPDDPPWAWISAIATALATLEPASSGRAIPPGVVIEGAVHLDPTVRLPHACTIQGPAWIGANSEIRPGAWIRGNVIAGADCVLGHACEFKNALLMDRVQVPHFSYVGDSILGNRAHLGAGVILSNLRLDQQPVRIRLPDRGMVDTGLRKLGAILGDDAEVGCNCVLQPGTVLGRRAQVWPLTAFGGVLGPGLIAANRGVARPEVFPRGN